MNKVLVTRITIFAAIFITGVVIATYMIGGAHKKKEVDESRPNVYAPADIVDKTMVDSSLLHKGSNHYIADFSLTNQYGEEVTHKTVKGKVYVTDFFFTTCPTICPRMTNQLERVQKAFKDEDKFMILSHSVWPEVDTVEVISNYADLHGAIKNKWHFLTGNKETIYNLARKSYFTLKPAEGENVGDGDSDFIHSNLFVLVDAKRQIRGFYDGTSKTDVNKMIKDALFLIENE